MDLKDLIQELNQNPAYRQAEYNLRFNLRLGNAVLYARIERGWSQSELARRVQTRQANISRIESAIANPTLDLIRRLCDVLDLDLNFSAPCIEEKQFISGSSSETLIRINDQPDSIYSQLFDTHQKRNA